MKCFIRECEEMTNSRCFQRPIVDWSVLLCSASRMWLCLEICSPQDTSWSRQMSLRPWHLAAGYSHLHAFHLPKVHYTRIFFEGRARTTCCSSGLEAQNIGNLLSLMTEARIWFPLLWVQERLTELLQVPNLLLNLMLSFQIQLVCQVIGALAEGGRYQR